MARQQGAWIGATRMAAVVVVLLDRSPLLILSSPSGSTSRRRAQVLSRDCGAAAQQARARSAADAPTPSKSVFFVLLPLTSPATPLRVPIPSYAM